MGIHWIDLIVLCSTLFIIIAYGIYASKKSSQDVNQYLKGTEPMKWWTIGLSVMATQASAITFMSTPGQAFHDGMGFIQVYFGLPIAMIIICITFIPIYHKLNVYTAYEYLENRFDNKTRTFTAILFLLQRGLSAGITIFAPSIILSTILGWNLSTLNIIIGSLVVLYTLTGGTKAVSITQKQQMAVMLGGMFVAFLYILYKLPNHVSLSDAFTIAGSSNKMKMVDFSFDLENRYTFWSGITGGLFLALSYFGTDQSQVQRYISGNNIQESRLGLIFNGLFKVPMQFFILLCGVMVFVFYQYNKAPLFFNNVALEKAKVKYEKEINEQEFKLAEVYNLRSKLLQNSDINLNSIEIKNQLLDLHNRERAIREEVKGLVKKSGGEENDKDYVFINFVLSHLPKGIVGLLLAVIFCAAMSSSSSEISALATCSTIDIYKRNFAPNKSEADYLRAGKWFTFLWGVIAISFANISSLFENLIQFVNIIGSIFYGTILGIFLTGFYIKRIKGNHVFPAALITQLGIIFLYKADVVGYLWLNAIGCASVILISSLFSALDKN